MGDREIVLSLIGSLTLCDHMGDVSNDVDEALKQLGMEDVLKEVEEIDDGEFFPALAKVLHKRGVKTLYDTDLAYDEHTDGSDGGKG